MLNVATLESLVRWSRCGREAPPTWCPLSSSGRRKRRRGRRRGKEEEREGTLVCHCRQTYRLKLLVAAAVTVSASMISLSMLSISCLRAPASLLRIDSSLIACTEMDSEMDTRGAWHGHSQQWRRTRTRIEARRAERRGPREGKD